MEPLFFKAENCPDTTTRTKTVSGASMEPLFFKAENVLCGIWACTLLPGFNGAAFFQSGKFGTELDATTDWTASMEPLFFKAENRQGPGRTRRRTRRFNGAAFFQSGK